MKMKVYEKYAREIPQDATRIIASLDDPIRIAILVLLNKNNELSFSDIKKELGLTKLTLNYHLKNLYSTGLTDHYFRHELGNQRYSYYSITDLGKRVLSSLVKVLIPPIPSQNMKIGLFEVLGTDTLRDRKTASAVIEKISETSSSCPIQLDFAGIVFASRAFCHELLTYIETRDNVQFENVSKEIEQMMIAALKKPEHSDYPMKKLVIG